MSPLTQRLSESDMTYRLPRAECQLYEPLSNDEGMCMASPNQRIVSRTSGDCNCPRKCSDLKRYLETVKRK